MYKKTIMKNFLKYYLIAGLLLIPLLLSSQINNVQVTVEGRQIIITYDYFAQSESIDDVIVTYSTGNSKEEKEAKQLTGDLYNITPGKGKRIVWNPLNELTSLTVENLVIHLSGVRNKAKLAECNKSLALANRFFADKDYEKAIFYYNEMLDCKTCNCNPIDIIYADDQLRLSKIYLKIKKDKFHISYLFDMATVKGGNNLNGVSAFLLRNKGIGYYASFRSDKNFYSRQKNMSYYTNESLRQNYDLNQLDNSRISSWLFSTGLTRKLITNEYVSAFLYGGIGFGSNSIAKDYNVTERGHTETLWITDGKQRMFLSPELGIMANVFDYFSVMAGLKNPVSISNHTELTMKGLSAMFGLGIKLKSFEKNNYNRKNTYLAYVVDLPDKKGQSSNIIGISLGTVSYSKLGRYLSLRINPLLINHKEVSELTESSLYTGVYDYENAFATVGLTWMYFYGGIGISYQKEYKKYDNVSNDIWNSQRERTGICTEFGLNLRLIDRLLLRGGVTFPNFDLTNKNNKFKMGSNSMFWSLGLGYVFQI